MGEDMYSQWRHRVGAKAEERVLMTIEETLDVGGRSLSSGELDDLKDCYKILCMIHKHHHRHDEEEGHAAPVAAPKPLAGVLGK